eukprot:Protomagalhaensia_sp_Gyna_25__369@NODE_1173_length_2099_cov_19_897087_g932_i0_p1_GENE_NODE_1173_length_2099_cov_19_897087_g932_i0NODE_1173_length_2099_cov_19_897087_g932_i0_p1_ORF_typecomplete_len213_score28_71_NODE_1173_length_2099_cov_19_897087_g932_i08381476
MKGSVLLLAAVASARTEFVEVCQKAKLPECQASCLDVAETCLKELKGSRTQSAMDSCVTQQTMVACDLELKAAEMALAVILCESSMAEIGAGDCASLCETVFQERVCQDSLDVCVLERCFATKSIFTEPNYTTLKPPGKNDEIATRPPQWVGEAIDSCSRMKGIRPLYTGECRSNCWYLASRRGYLCDSLVQSYDAFIKCFEMAYGNKCLFQ